MHRCTERSREIPDHCAEGGKPITTVCILQHCLGSREPPPKHTRLFGRHKLLRCNTKQQLRHHCSGGAGEPRLHHHGSGGGGACPVIFLFNIWKTRGAREGWTRGLAGCGQVIWQGQAGQGAGPAWPAGRPAVHSSSLAPTPSPSPAGQPASAHLTVPLPPLLFCLCLVNGLHNRRAQQCEPTLVACSTLWPPHVKRLPHRSLPAGNDRLCDLSALPAHLLPPLRRQEDARPEDDRGRRCRCRRHHDLWPHLWGMQRQGESGHGDRWV